jgi:hypothetical protein
MKTQNDSFMELIKLKAENPYMDVFFMVDNSDSHTAHRINFITIEHIMRDDDSYLIGANCILENIADASGFIYESIEAAQKEIDTIKMAIMVYMAAIGTQKCFVSINVDQ